MSHNRRTYSGLQLREACVGAILVIARAYIYVSEGEDKLRPYQE